MINQRPEKKLHTTNFEPGTAMFVSGKILYSAINNRIEGERLDKYIENAVRNNVKHITRREHYSITLRNCFNMGSDKEMFSSPQKPSKEKLFLYERFYQPKDSAKSDYKPCYSAHSFSNRPIPFYCRDNAKSKEVKKVIIPKDHELKEGTPVTVVLRIFKASPSNGLTIDSVIIDTNDFELINITGASGTATLNKLGLVSVDEEKPIIKDEVINFAENEKATDDKVMEDPWADLTSEYGELYNN